MYSGNINRPYLAAYVPNYLPLPQGEGWTEQLLQQQMEGEEEDEKGDKKEDPNDILIGKLSTLIDSKLADFKTKSLDPSIQGLDKKYDRILNPKGEKKGKDGKPIKKTAPPPAPEEDDDDELNEDADTEELGIPKDSKADLYVRRMRRELREIRGTVGEIIEDRDKTKAESEANRKKASVMEVVGNPKYRWASDFIKNLVIRDLMDTVVFDDKGVAMYGKDGAKLSEYVKDMYERDKSVRSATQKGGSGNSNESEETGDFKNVDTYTVEDVKDPKKYDQTVREALKRAQRT